MKEPTPGQLRWERFLCGLAAGTLAKLGTHPLDVCKKRFQVCWRAACDPTLIVGVAAEQCAACLLESVNTAVLVQIVGLQRSVRYGARVPHESVRSIPGCMRQIWQREGVRGLYKGALPSIIKAAPSAAVTFTAYEYILSLLSAMAAQSSLAKDALGC